jgi:DNA-binding Lrp family transcriptional regulator
MKTNVAENSLHAYWAMRDSGELPEKERIVYEALVKHGRMTREQIAAKTGMKEGSVCGRIDGLKKKGLVRGVATMVNPVTDCLNEIVDIAEHRKQLQVELELV